MTNAIIKGVIARAQAKGEVRLCAVVVASNHVHWLLVPESTRTLAEFMRFVNSNIARKVGRLVGWREKFWSRRYQAIIVSDEEEAQAARLRYVLSHGPKENLVDRAGDWPGVHVVAELCAGVAEVHGGLWRDQTAEYEARRRQTVDDPPLDPESFVTRSSFVLSPLPCWEHRDRAEVVETISQLVKAIEAEHRERRRAEGRSCLGKRRIAAQSPFDQPIHPKRSPAPPCHAASRVERVKLIERYRAFVAAYRYAAQRLAEGVRGVLFPDGCFPPGLPYVPELRAGPAP
jgi:hypothetical protein